MKFENRKEGYEKMAKFIIHSFGTVKKFTIQNTKNISAIFLAGAPGSGKTEFLDTIFLDLKDSFIIIDVDQYRQLFKGYNGENSHIFQQGSVKVADKILKFCFKNNLNFIFDGTFRNYNKIKENFGQCKKYKRYSLINLIYQEPRISFYYTFLRKLKKKRNVPIDVFINGFYGSIENVFKAVKDFNNVDLMIAHKVYAFLDKDKGIFRIDYQTNNIYDFCAKYRIVYKKGTFKNQEYLKLDIENYNNILMKEKISKGSLYLKAKIWALEKFFKSF